MPSLINLDAGAITGLIQKGIDRIWPDKSEQEKQQLANESAQILGQLNINLEEAKSPNWFVAGWRPAVGWVCVLGLVVQFFIFPIAAFFVEKMPALDTGQLITLLLTLLGMGTLRTIEKHNDVADNH